MPAGSASLYNRLFLVAPLILVGLGLLGLAALDRMGRLPAPPLTATNCIDEKFKFLHETDIRRPGIVAVGSSATWRNIDFSAFGADSGPGGALNAAPCYLMAHETAYMARFLVEGLPSAHAVVTVFAMRDFEACEGDGAFFDRSDAAAYVFDRRPGWHLYFKNLRIRSFLGDVLRVKDMRSGADALRPLVMDRYGSGPISAEPPVVWPGVRVREDCLAHLAPLAADLDARGVRWTVVLLPPMPSWIDAHDPDHVSDRTWRRQVADRLRGTGALVLDAAALPVVDADFADPAHLHWRSVPAFTAWIADAMRANGVIGTPGAGVAHAL